MPWPGPLESHDRSELADSLRAFGHIVVRAWSAGEALILTRSDSPALAIIDRWHGDDADSLKLAGYLVGKGIKVLWLGEAPYSLAGTSDALVAVLPPPCDAISVLSAVNALAHRF